MLALVAVVALAFLHVVSIATGGDVGHRLLGLRVVRPAGTRIGFRRALIREVGFALAVSPIAIGVLWSLLDRQRQGWHDKLAGSVVVPRVDAPGVDGSGRRRAVAATVSVTVIVAALIGGANVAQALPPRLDAISRSSAPPLTPLTLTVGAIHRERTTSIRFLSGADVDLELPAIAVNATVLRTIAPYLGGGPRSLSIQVVQRLGKAQWRSEAMPFSLLALPAVDATQAGVTASRLLDVIDVVAPATRQRLTGSLGAGSLAVALDRMVAAGASLQRTLQARTQPETLIRVRESNLVIQPGDGPTLREIDQIVAAALVATGPSSPSPCIAKDAYMDDLFKQARGDPAHDPGGRFWAGVLGCASDELLEVAERLGFAVTALTLIALGAGVTFSLAATLAITAVVISVALFVIVAELQALALTAEREHAARLAKGLDQLVHSLVDPFVDALLALTNPAAVVGWQIVQAGVAIAHEASAYIARIGASPSPSPLPSALTAALSAAPTPRTTPPPSVAPRTVAPTAAPRATTAPRPTPAGTAATTAAPAQPTVVPPAVVVTATPQLLALPTLPGTGRITFDPPPLDDAIAGSPYRGPILMNFVRDGSPPYHFQLETLGGFPPQGIVLAPDGTLSGTPADATAGRSYTFGICAVDLRGESACRSARVAVVAVTLVVTSKQCIDLGGVPQRYRMILVGTATAPTGTWLSTGLMRTQCQGWGPDPFGGCRRAAGQPELLTWTSTDERFVNPGLPMSELLQLVYTPPSEQASVNRMMTSTCP